MKTQSGSRNLAMATLQLLRRKTHQLKHPTHHETDPRGPSVCNVPDPSEYDPAAHLVHVLLLVDPDAPNRFSVDFEA
jgi:hypothetical protein